MTIAQAAALGALQGATEFLPVSSSGHLVIAQHVFGLTQSEFRFDVMVHGGTLLALLAYYGRELFRLSRRWLVELAIATIVTAVIALPVKDQLAKLYGSIDWIGIEFIITGTVLFFTRNVQGTRREIGIGTAVVIGIAQAIAVSPGISRSGATIAAALLLGVARPEAARFAFLLAIPAIAGALVLEGVDATAGGTAGPAALWVGSVAAAVFGYAALRWAVSVVSSGRVHLFAYYLWPMGAAIFLWSIFTR